MGHYLLTSANCRILSALCIIIHILVALVQAYESSRIGGTGRWRPLVLDPDTTFLYDTSYE